MQTRFYREDASPVNHDPRNLLRTQDPEPWHEENSNLYRRESFAARDARIGRAPLLFPHPVARVHRHRQPRDLVPGGNGGTVLQHDILQHGRHTLREAVLP